jgi:hypothetical protein
MEVKNGPLVGSLSGSPWKGFGCARDNDGDVLLEERESADSEDDLTKMLAGSGRAACEEDLGTPKRWDRRYAEAVRWPTVPLFYKGNADTLFAGSRNILVVWDDNLFGSWFWLKELMFSFCICCSLVIRVVVLKMAEQNRNIYIPGLTDSLLETRL